MGDKIFIGKKEVHENPINDSHYQGLLGLNPALKTEINRHVRDVLFEDIRELHKDELPDNSAIISEADIMHAKEELKGELMLLEQSTEESKHIVVIMDDCFTNQKLLVLLRNILGKEDFDRFVKVVDIDYDAPADNEYLEENLAMNHTLFLLGGSLSDTYGMHDSHYSSYLANIIQQNGDEYTLRFLNNRFAGTCFGQQYLANIIGATNKNSSGIIATLKGPTQFAPSYCTIEDLKYVNPVYADILKGLSNSGKNKHFSSIFTRSGYVSFDLLKSGGSLGVVPLIKDEATSGIVGWGSKNGNIFGIQFHPEINFLSQTHNTRKHLRKITKSLSTSEEEQTKYLENFEIEGKITRDVDEAFYVFLLLGYIRDINNSRILRLSTFNDEPTSPETVSYDEATRRLIKTITDRVDFIMEDNAHLGDELVAQKWIDAIDKKGRLLLNYQLDWKVNRSIDEVSEILGIRSIIDLIQDHRKLQCEGNYVVRDLGAGDGNTIKELYSTIRNQDIIFYGTGDYIYFDLYSALGNTHFKELLPEEILILFVEKAVMEFRTLSGDSTIEKILQSIQNVLFSASDTIRNSSMTNKKTLMFESEHESPLSPEIQADFPKYESMLNELKAYVTGNIYALFSNFFKRIYISKFNDLVIRDELISKLDFQFSIRATSHVNGREYMKIISEYFYDSAKPGSIFLDNGIHQSYTSIPRLKELYEVSLDLANGKCRLIYNKKKNYFSSVIITKQIHYTDEFLEAHLDPNHIIVPLKEAYESTFFQLAYFIRNFIISNFKNNIVFWNFNEQITDTLKTIMKELEEKHIENIPGIILDLINHIAKNYRDRGTVYNEIDMSILDSYHIDGKSLHDILSTDIFIPTWMNVYADSDY